MKFDGAGVKDVACTVDCEAGLQVMNPALFAKLDNEGQKIKVSEMLKSEPHAAADSDPSMPRTTRLAGGSHAGIALPSHHPLDLVLYG